MDKIVLNLLLMMLKKQLLLSFISLGLITHSFAGQTPLVTNRSMGPDLIISTVPNKIPKAFDQSLSLRFAESCLEYLQSVTCFSSNGASGFDPYCRFKKPGPDMTEKIKTLIDSLPEFHQKVFCHIDRLQVHEKISSIAYATIIQNQAGENLGGMVGIRKDALDSKKAGGDLFSWKEQLSFGLSQANDPRYTISGEGPRISMSISSVPKRETALLYILVHETSHLIDFMNEANNQQCTASRDLGTYLCTQGEDSFGNLSWPKSYKLDDGLNSLPQEYSWLSKLCYYNCERHIPQASIKDLYGELSRSSFITTYSSMNQMEDFAEASAAFSLKDKGYTYQVIGQGDEVLFDLEWSWETHFKEKRDWLERFYSQTHLKYKFR